MPLNGRSEKLFVDLSVVVLFGFSLLASPLKGFSLKAFTGLLLLNSVPLSGWLALRVRVVGLSV